MIGKKILNPKKSASKTERVSGLADYILCKDDPDKLVHAGARGFTTTTDAGRVAEMIALSTDATRSRDPISHYVLSWREHERPSAEQIEQAIDIFEMETGLTGHQIIYGVHDDTDNLHLHIAVNRARDTFEKDAPYGAAGVVKIDFDKDVIHRVVARIEAGQGWEREARGRYQIDPAGQLVRTSRDDTTRTPSTRAQDYEARTGSKSAERVGQEAAAPIIRQAHTWDDLHAGLAAHGMRYERKGSGAIVWIGEQAVKASSVDRGAAIGRLQARLGPFQAAGAAHERPPRNPEPMPGGRPEWDQYSKDRKDLQGSKSAAWQALRERHSDERKDLFGDQAKERQATLAGDWRGRGALLNGLRSQLAAEQAGAKADQRDRHDQERETLRKEFPPVQDFSTWRRKQGHDQPAAGIVRGEGTDALTERPRLQDIRAFVARQVGRQVEYSRADEGSHGGGAAFVDQGRQIRIIKSDEVTIRAALQLAERRFAGKALVLSGDETFKTRAARVAARNGITIANPELQEFIKAEHQARDAARRAEPPAPQAERPADTLRAKLAREREADAFRIKVQEAVERAKQRQAEGTQANPSPARSEAGPEPPREALKRALRGLSDADLSAATRTPRVSVEDAARRLSPAYAQAADRLAALERTAEQIKTDIKHAGEAAERKNAEDDARWTGMGWLRQVASKAGVPDQELARLDAERDAAVTRLAALTETRDKTAAAIGAAAEAKTAAFQQILPRAEAAVRSAEERAGLAKEVRAEREAEKKAEQQRAEVQRQTRLAALTPQQMDINDRMIASLQEQWLAADDGSREAAGLKAMTEKARALAADGRELDQCQDKVLEAGREAQREYEHDRGHGR
jgi:hypothetical protein